MRASHPQLLASLLDDNSATLQSIQKKITAILQLDNIIESLLPAPLRPLCRVVNYRRGILVMNIANSSGLLLLRYEQSRLLSALRNGILPSLVTIDIKINPTLIRNDAEKQSVGKSIMLNRPVFRADRHLSLKSAEYLREIAKRSPEKLKKRLEQLASLAEKNSNDAEQKK